MSKPIVYNIVQIVPDPLRGEVMNVGIVLHDEAGPRLRVRLVPARLRALSPALGQIVPSDWIEAWERTLNMFENVDQKWSWLRNAMAPLSVNPAEGVIYASDSADLENQVEAILQRMVMPQKAVRGSSKKRIKRSDLQNQLTTWLRSQKLFSRNMTDLAKHRVVASYPLNIEEEMFAEFALKNGSIHVMETLDLRGHAHYTKGLRNEASHKAMVLDFAQDTLEIASKRIAVVAADDYAEMKPAMSLINRKASHVLCIDSPSDRQWLADFIAESLHIPTLLPPTPQPFNITVGESALLDPTAAIGGGTGVNALQKH